MKKIVKELNSPVNLISYHSTSKGLIGECGLRCVYMELHNIDKEVYIINIRFMNKYLN